MHSATVYPLDISSKHVAINREASYFTLNAKGGYAMAAEIVSLYYENKR
jgi:hypothetical protein